MKAIGYITFFVVSATLSILWSGYVLSVLWRWFMVPGLGLPPLSIGYAIGLAIVVGYITKEESASPKDKEWNEILTEAFLKAALRPALALGMGAIVVAFL